MKLLNLTAAISAALVSVLPNVCLSQTLGKGAKYPEVSTAYLPNCYVETSDHRILDLTSMCVVPKETNDSSTAETAEIAHSNTKQSVENTEAIQRAKKLRACEQYDRDCPESESAAVVPY